jgi:mono/diheme cytochrome c family protein
MRLIATVAAAAAVVLVLASCGDDGDSGDTVAQETATQGAPQAPDPEQPLSPAEMHGRGLFIENCGSCHTLDAAGTQGQIGPNLGDIPLDEDEVLAAIENGGTGSGNMPSGLLSGQDAQDVAAFIAKSGPGASGP